MGALESNAKLSRPPPPRRCRVKQRHARVLVSVRAPWRKEGMFGVEGVLQNHMVVRMSVTRSDRRERKNRNMEQKVRNEKKTIKKKRAAIVLNQPEHPGSAWQE